MLFFRQLDWKEFSNQPHIKKLPINEQMQQFNYHLQQMSNLNRMQPKGPGSRATSTTPAPTATPTATPTNTPVPTDTPTPAPTDTPTATPTNTPVPTDTPTATPTNTPVPTDTPTPTPTATQSSPNAAPDTFKVSLIDSSGNPDTVRYQFGFNQAGGLGNNGVQLSEGQTFDYTIETSTVTMSLVRLLNTIAPSGGSITIIPNSNYTSITSPTGKSLNYTFSSGDNIDGSSDWTWTFTGVDNGNFACDIIVNEGDI